MKYYLPTGEWPLKRDLYDNHMFSMGHSPTHIQEDADFLLLPGGADIGMRPARDEAEKAAYYVFSDTGRPTIGICRGLQMVLYLHGESLIDDIDDKKVNHMTQTKHWTGVSSWHKTKQGFLTNTRHHQGFWANGINNKWTVLDESQDGILESVMGQDFLGVQWHPEMPEMLGTPALKWWVEQVNRFLYEKTH
jgi:gamma-glutamyl-gamma-aminobutyrate hydrolase PuuD